MNSSFPSLLGWAECPQGELILVPNSIRVNYWYLNIYLLWINTIFNIILPIILLIVLNVLVTRKIEEHLDNLDKTSATASNQPSDRLQREVRIMNTI